MVYSENCTDRTTYWNNKTGTCVPCDKPAKGRGISPNCGRNDRGGKHEASTRPCPDNTFNDGSYFKCQNCTSCPPGFTTVSVCSFTSDTKCQDFRTTKGPVTEPADVPDVATFTDPSTVVLTAPVTVYTLKQTQFYCRYQTRNEPIQTNQTSVTAVAHSSVLWAVPLAFLLCILLVGLCAWIIYTRKEQGRNMVLHYARRSSFMGAGFTTLSAPLGNNDLENLLSPNILSAPLQIVLDDLDVLEELVILLDPETQSVKNTKHLASHCSFPSTWVTYTYSMKESKSPLKTVLEGVTSRHPEWTVGHLAKLLRQMERNDAVSVLAKLNKIDV